MTVSVKDRDDDDDDDDIEASLLAPVAAWRWRSEDTPLVVGIDKNKRADETTRVHDNFMVVVLLCVSCFKMSSVFMRCEK